MFTIPQRRSASRETRGLALLGVALSAMSLASATSSRAQALFRDVHDVNVSSDYSLMEVQQTADGGFAVAGGRPMFFLKTDASGALDFCQRYDADEATAFDQTADGGYILAGERISYDQPLLVKTDAAGVPQWSTTYSQSFGIQGFYSVRATIDGGCVASGIYTLKVDAAGVLQWNRIHIGGGGNVNCIRTTSGGGFVATGEGQYGNCAGDYNLVVTRLDALGNSTWNRCYGGDAYDWGAGVEQTSDDGFIVAGWTGSYGAGGRDGFLVKLDASGAVAWSFAYGTPGDDALYSVTEVAGGSFVAAGAFDGQLAMIRVGDTGTIVWAKAYPSSPGARNSTLYSVRETSDLGYIAAGKDESGRLVLVRTDSAGSTGACALTLPLVVVTPAPFATGVNSTNSPGTWVTASVVTTPTPSTPALTPCVPVVNSPPTCSAGPDISVSCGAVSIGGATATDPDRGDRLRFTWTTSCPGTVFSPSTSVLNPVVGFGPGCGVTCDLTLVVDDGHGGTCTDVVRVDINDVTPPAIACPPDLLFECGDAIPPADPTAVIASDDCSAATVTHVGDVATGACPATVLRTYRATDACGNSADCTQTITVDDRQSPETLCTDGLDNDGDTLADCLDPDCALDPAADCDGDVAPNGTDCDPRDPTSFAVPPEVTRLDVTKSGAGDAVALAWTDVSALAGSGTLSDVVGGVISDLWRDRGFASAACVVQDIAPAAAVDARPMPPHAPGFAGDGWYYLVRAQDSCGSGDYGSGTLGLRAIDILLCE